jgi:lipoprotein-releasing system permease protein
MNFETFVARRYLISKHKVNFITIISFLSIAGITIGVASLIIVLSVFNGFGSLVSGYLLSLDPHIKISSSTVAAEKQIDMIPEVLNNTNNVKYYAPFVEGKLLAYNKGITQVAYLKGIEEETGKKLYNLEASIVYGTLDIKEEDTFSNLVIGIQLADRLQVLVGDTLILVSPVGIEKVITQFSRPLTKKFIISGIFNSNNNEYDAGYMFTNLKTAQFLLGYNTPQGYEAKLSDVNDAFSVKEQIQTKIDINNFSINTWYDTHQELYSVMQIERWTAYIILSLIIAVATFNILGSLSMSVIEKKRDIGVFRTLGVNEKSVVKIFMFEGILIGILGTILGVILGYLICYLQIEYNLYPLNPSQYKIDSLPIEIRISDFFFISGASMLLSFLASLYPAKRAARINTIEAIKWE